MSYVTMYKSLSFSVKSVVVIRMHIIMIVKEARYMRSVWGGWKGD